MKKIFINIIKIYQRTPFHSHSYCRFYPSCSNYMIDAINYYGVLIGTFYGIKRLLRCNPFGKSGYDPIVKIEKE